MSKIGASPQCRAFLNLLAETLGTSSHPLTRADGYDIIVSGIDGYNRFDDYSQHPFAGTRPPVTTREPQCGNIGHRFPIDPSRHVSPTPAIEPLQSTRSGRYLLPLDAWNQGRLALGLGTFGPTQQDMCAVFWLSKLQAYAFIESGQIEEAAIRSSAVWEELPYNLYQQGAKDMAWIRSRYLALLAAEK